MPLIDHFHPPFSKERHWESFYATWIGSIADALNENLLPKGYFAEEQVHPSAELEIDVATFEEQAWDRADPGGTTTVARKTWMPAAPTWTIPGVINEGAELLVFQSDGGTRLVAAIELVSPANKDRPETRRTFAAKCASYLSAGVSLIVIDVVTRRKANLHNELMAMLGEESGSCQSAAEIYAIAYRPLLRNSSREIEIWASDLAIGKTLPELPLWIAPDLAVPIHLETAYQDACRRRRLTA